MKEGGLRIKGEEEENTESWDGLKKEGGVNMVLFKL